MKRCSYCRTHYQGELNCHNCGAPAETSEPLGGMPAWYGAALARQTRNDHYLLAFGMVVVVINLVKLFQALS